jgi:hypothetical protein
MVKTLRFQDQNVEVPGFGAMGISFALGNDLSYEEAEPVLLKALELGCTFWDTAVSEIYFELVQSRCADLEGFLQSWRQWEDPWWLHQKA